MLHDEKTAMTANENTLFYKEAPVSPFITIRECYIWQYLWQSLCHRILFM